MKKTLKFALIFILLFVTGMLCNSTVNAYNDADIKAGNEVESGLVNKIHEENYNGKIYYIADVSGSTMLNLLTKESKLNTLKQADNYIYDNLYFKLADGATTASVEYSNNIKKELEIVTIDGQKYAKCPIGIIMKVDNTYYPACLHCDGFGDLGEFDSGKVKFSNENNETEEVNFKVSFFGGDESYNGAYVYMSSTTTKDYYHGGAGENPVGGQDFDRVMAEGDCYITVDLPVKVGDNIKIEPFGTLSYVGKGETYEYQYKAVITDKTIFNKNILGSILIPEYNIMYFFRLNFSGDLVKNDKQPISTIDKSTNIKLSATNTELPSNTKLEVNKITNGKTYELVNKTLGDMIKDIQVYDINLTSDNVKFQPNGNVKISIPIPNEINIDNLLIYRISNDGEKVQYSYTIEVVDNVRYATIETNHFSIYAIGEKVEKDTSGDENSNEKENDSNQKIENNTEQEEKQHILDDEPKTGYDNISKLSIIGYVITALGFGILKYKI